MEEYILKNNLKLIYKKSENELSSICISLNAGAGVENDKLGIAHAAEHMIYKGTVNRSEKQINEELSNIFGFNNAMTNYPYVIYYGTLLSEDLEKGIELFSDLLINPTFESYGFNDEMNVIKEELKEWDEELDQYCEDKLFFNSFDNRRIKYPIIGTKESLEDIVLNDIRGFYEKYYFPENASIVVISSLDFEEVKNMVNQYFISWENRFERKKCSKEDADHTIEKKKINYEIPKREIFINHIGKSKTCKVEIICPIDSLSQKEMKTFRIFNQCFGEGVNSILYDILRTKNGLIYDVITKVSNENYIKLYKINFSTSKENIEKTLKLIEESIEKICDYINNDNRIIINDLAKSFKLKRLFREEQSIILAKELATYDTMFGDYNIYLDETNDLNLVSKKDMINVSKKVFNNLTVQIID